MALEIKDSNFEELLASGKPLVVDFGQHGVDLVRRLLRM